MVRKHSISLQSEHHDVYQDFFNKHDLVISLPHIFRWAPSLMRGDSMNRNSGNLVIKQKLSTKMYVGVKSTGLKDKVVVDSITNYNGIEGKFVTVEGCQVLSDEKLLKLNKVITQILGAHNYTKGLEINVLSEHMRGHGFGFMGSLCTLLASLILILIGKVTQKELAEYDEFSGGPLAEEIAALSLHIDIARGGTPLGLLPVVSLSSSKWPMIQFGTPSVSYNGENKSFSLDSSNYRVFQLTELTKGELDSMPIDYGIISFGVAYNSGEIRRKYEHFQKFYEETYDFLKDLKKTYEIPCENLMKEHCDIEMVSKFCTVNMLNYLKKMMENSSQEYYVDAFIQSIIDCGVHNSLLEREKRNIVDMYYWFEHLKSFAKEKIGIVPISTAKVGGSFLFVCNKNNSRGTMEKLLIKLQTEGYDTVNYEYLSWRDGMCSDGLQMHQYIGKGIFSQYIKQGSVVFLSSNGDRYISNHSDILMKERKGLLLDSVYRKIYLDGEKLTHKHLRSQSATVEILEVLYGNKGSYVHNSELPVSSYSKNKNEMVGKIILPLITLIKDEFNKSIELECKGSIYDFHVRLVDDKGVLNRIKGLH